MSVRKLNKNDFTVGQEVALRFQGNRARYEEHKEYGYKKGVVEKIGNKLITVDGKQFKLEDGYNKSNYSPDYQLYETEEALIEQIKREKTLDKLHSTFGRMSNNSDFSNEQLLEVLKVLNLEIK